MIVFAGTDTAGTFFYNQTDVYTGSVFNGGPALSAGKHSPGGCGTATAALSVGGVTAALRNETESYNGTAWSTQGNIVTSRRDFSAVGTTTAALNFGGANLAYSTFYANAETYSGGAWSNAASNLATARYGHPGCGTSTNALAVAGSPSTGLITSVESFNGTTWSSETAIGSSEGRYGSGNGAGSGRADCFIVAGYNATGPVVATTTYYNGSAWASRASVPVNSWQHGVAGSSSSLTMAGGAASTGNVAVATSYSYR